jgi:DNA-binding MarR family transcriptional regulator
MASLDTDVERLENALRLFVQTIKRPQHWANITAQVGVTLDRPSATILRMLIMHEPRRMRVQDLAHELGIESPSVTRKTQQLEELGYIQRQPDANDKRAVSLMVTPAGYTVAAKLWAVQRQSIVKVLADWPEEQRHQLVGLLERFSGELHEATKH